MKPRVAFADLQWLAAFERIKVLPKKTVLKARGQEFQLDYVLDDPHPPSAWFKARINGKLRTVGIRKGESLLCELA